MEKMLISQITISQGLIVICEIAQFALFRNFVISQFRKLQ